VGEDITGIGASTGKSDAVRSAIRIRRQRIHQRESKNAQPASQAANSSAGAIGGVTAVEGAAKAGAGDSANGCAICRIAGATGGATPAAVRQSILLPTLTSRAQGIRNLIDAACQTM